MFTVEKEKELIAAQKLSILCLDHPVEDANITGQKRKRQVSEKKPELSLFKKIIAAAKTIIKNNATNYARFVFVETDSGSRYFVVTSSNNPTSSGFLVNLPRVLPFEKDPDAIVFKNIYYEAKNYHHKKFFGKRIILEVNINNPAAIAYIKLRAQIIVDTTQKETPTESSQSPTPASNNELPPALPAPPILPETSSAPLAPMGFSTQLLALGLQQAGVLPAVTNCLVALSWAKDNINQARRNQLTNLQALSYLNANGFLSLQNSATLDSQTLTALAHALIHSRPMP